MNMQVQSEQQKNWQTSCEKNSQNNRSISGSRRSSSKKAGFYTREVSKVYSQFLHKKSGFAIQKSTEPVSPLSTKSKESKTKGKTIGINENSVRKPFLDIQGKQDYKNPVQNQGKRLCGPESKSKLNQKFGSRVENQADGSRDLIVRNGGRGSIKEQRGLKEEESAHGIGKKEEKDSSSQILQNVTFSPKYNCGTSHWGSCAEQWPGREYLLIQENALVASPETPGQKQSHAGFNSKIQDELLKNNGSFSNKRNQNKQVVDKENEQSRSMCSKRISRQSNGVQLPAQVLSPSKQYQNQSNGQSLSSFTANAPIQLINDSDIKDFGVGQFEQQNRKTDAPLFSKGKENYVQISIKNRSRASKMPSASKTVSVTGQESTTQQQTTTNSNQKSSKSNICKVPNSKYWSCNVEQTDKPQSNNQTLLQQYDANMAKGEEFGLPKQEQTVIISQEVEKQVKTHFSEKKGTEAVDDQSDSNSTIHNMYLIGSTAEMRFKKSKVYAQRVKKVAKNSRLFQPDSFDTNNSKQFQSKLFKDQDFADGESVKETQRTPNYKADEQDYQSSPDNVIKRIIRNTRKSQERMQNVLCQKLAQSIRVSMINELKAQAPNTDQIQSRVQILNSRSTSNEIVIAPTDTSIMKPQTLSSDLNLSYSQPQTRRSDDDISTSKSKSCTRKTHRRMRSDRRSSQHQAQGNSKSFNEHRDNSHSYHIENEQPLQENDPDLMLANPAIIKEPMVLKEQMYKQFQDQNHIDQTNQLQRVATDSGYDEETEEKQSELTHNLYREQAQNFELKPIQSNTENEQSLESFSKNLVNETTQPIQKQVSQKILESSDSEVKFLFDPLKSNFGRDSIQSLVGMANQGVGQPSSIQRGDRITRNSIGTRHKILICSDSLEQIEMLSPSQVDFIENEQQVQNELIDPKAYQRCCPEKKQPGFAGIKYSSVDNLQINQASSEEEAHTSNDENDQKSAQVGQVIQQKTPQSQNKLITKIQQDKSSRNSRPQTSMEEQSKSYDLNEQKFYAQEIVDMKSQLEQLRKDEAQIVMNQELIVKQEYSIKLSNNYSNDNTSRDDPKNHNQTFQDCILGAHPAIIQMSNDSGLNIVSATQMPLLSDIENSPLQYFGSSTQCQGQSMMICEPSSPHSKRQHNISMTDIQRHNHEDDVKIEQIENQTSRSFDRSKSSKGTQFQDSPNRLHQQYVTFSKQKRFILEPQQQSNAEADHSQSQSQQSPLKHQTSQITNSLIPETDQEDIVSDEQQREWFTFQPSHGRNIIQYQQQTTQTNSNDDFQLQPMIVNNKHQDIEIEANHDSVGNKDQSQMESSQKKISQDDYNCHSAYMMQTISEPAQSLQQNNYQTNKYSTQMQDSRNDIDQSVISTGNSSQGAGQKKQRRSRKCRSTSTNNNYVQKKVTDYQKQVDDDQIVSSPKIIGNTMLSINKQIETSLNEQHCQPSQMDQKLNSYPHQQNLSLNQTCGSQHNIMHPMIKTPTDKSYPKNEPLLNNLKQNDTCDKGVHEIFSETGLLDDKTLPSDQKNATVFLKIDQEQYIPMPRSQFQSALTSPQIADNEIEHHSQYMQTIQSNLQTLQSSQHMQQLKPTPFNQTQNQSQNYHCSQQSQSSQKQSHLQQTQQLAKSLSQNKGQELKFHRPNIPSSLYGEEFRSMHNFDSINDNQYLQTMGSNEQHFQNQFQQPSVPIAPSLDTSTPIPQAYNLTSPHHQSHLQTLDANISPTPTTPLAHLPHTPQANISQHPQNFEQANGNNLDSQGPVWAEKRMFGQEREGCGGGGCCAEQRFGSRRCSGWHGGSGGEVLEAGEGVWSKQVQGLKRNMSMDEQMDINCKGSFVQQEQFNLQTLPVDFNSANQQSTFGNDNGYQARKNVKTVSNSKKKQKMRNNFSNGSYLQAINPNNNCIINNQQVSTRTTELSNEKQKIFRNEARLRQIAQQYTFLNKSSVAHASYSRLSGTKHQIDNSKYRKVKCKNKAKVGMSHNLSINTSMNMQAVNNLSSMCQHQQFIQNQSGDAMMPGAHNQMNMNNSYFLDGASNMNNSTMCLHDTTIQPQHQDSIMQTSFHLQSMKRPSEAFNRPHTHNFNPLIHSTQGHLNNSSFSVTPKNNVSMNRDELLPAASAMKKYSNNFSRTINFNSQSMECEGKTRNINRSVPRGSNGNTIGNQASSQLMATNYTSLTTAKQILKRKHTYDNGSLGQQFDKQSHESQAAIKMKKYLTKSADQFRNYQTVSQSKGSITAFNKVTDKLQKQYASIVNGESVPKVNQARKSLNQLSKAYLKPTNSYNLKKKITPLKNVNYSSYDVRKSQDPEQNRNKQSQNRTQKSVDGIKHVGYKKPQVQNNQIKSQHETTFNGLRAPTKIQTSQINRQQQNKTNTVYNSNQNRGGISKRAHQFQSIMTTNRAVDKIVGMNRRASLKDLKDDLIQKSDNLVHQKSLFQFNKHHHQHSVDIHQDSLSHPLQQNSKTNPTSLNTSIQKPKNHFRHNLRRSIAVCHQTQQSQPQIQTDLLTNQSIQQLATGESEVKAPTELSGVAFQRRQFHRRPNTLEIGEERSQTKPGHWQQDRQEGV